MGSPRKSNPQAQANNAAQAQAQAQAVAQAQQAYNETSSAEAALIALGYCSRLVSSAQVLSPGKSGMANMMVQGQGQLQPMPAHNPKGMVGKGGAPMAVSMTQGQATQMVGGKAIMHRQPGMQQQQQQHQQHQQQHQQQQQHHQQPLVIGQLGRKKLSFTSAWIWLVYLCYPYLWNNR